VPKSVDPKHLERNVQTVINLYDLLSKAEALFSCLSESIDLTDILHVSSSLSFARLIMLEI
jgi:hypothetical protein